MSTPSPINYEKRRRVFLRQANTTYFSSAMNAALTDREKRLSDCLSALRRHQTKLFTNPSVDIPTSSLPPSSHGQPPGSIHFFQIHEYMQTTPLFKLLKAMPKGGLLHVHCDALVDRKFIIRKLAEWADRCYMRIWKREKSYPGAEGQTTDVPMFRFASSIPVDGEEWVSVKEARDNFSDGGPEGFDAWLYRCTTLRDRKGEFSRSTAVFPSEHAVWHEFENCFLTLSGLIQYFPLLKLYIREICNRYYLKEGVQYAEVRMPYIVPYDDKATETLTFDDVFKDAELAQREFKEKLREQGGDADADGFLGFKIIYSILRRIPRPEMRWHLDNAWRMRKLYPTLLAGFDLVGHEEKGNPLRHYIPEFLDFLRAQEGHSSEETLKFFLHAGETGNVGTEVDYENLVDALLLGTKRIGHGFAISKWLGSIGTWVKDHEVALEVCPISNQVLGLVHDLRNHPIGVWFGWSGAPSPLEALEREEEGKQDIPSKLSFIPVTISPDDPALFGYEGVTEDYWELFMSFDALNLAGLKQLIWNSVQYSAIVDEEKEKAMAVIKRLWEEWVEWAVEEAGRAMVEAAVPEMDGELTLVAKELSGY
ncbi:hypothetical protein BC937DRAFT_94684 [Endogone sp. FLAS-F59071]|nr:hypothetical protein BC937DRAFT_94684 [Endogone sp. FLAS-F59071]|eukprot:RUS20658.1 hypothetical protein BC937DRAFT_94684 [Endogone sp. FLAS-F59071]